MCGCNATAQHGICQGLGYPLVCALRGRNTCRWPRSPRRRRLRRGKVRHRWPRVLCERARDVVVCDVLPGPGRRVRAAGEVGEFAGARGRAPRFGAALAALGAKGESDAPRPHAGRARGANRAALIPLRHCRALPLIPHRSLPALPLIPHPSLPGLTRQSIVFAKMFWRRRWTRGSSPRVTLYGDQTTRQCDHGAAAMTASS
jgi:hypothetical protein